MPAACTTWSCGSPDLSRAIAEWGWLLTRLGYEQFQDWEAGRSWNLGGTYLVIEQSPAMSALDHDRLRPGLNDPAFQAGPREQVDKLTAEAPAHGWTLLFPDRHPHARCRPRPLRRLPSQHRRLRSRTSRRRSRGIP